MIAIQCIRLLTLVQKSGKDCKANGCPSSCNNHGYSTCGGIHQYAGNISEPNEWNQSIVCFCPNPYNPYTKRTPAFRRRRKAGHAPDIVEEVCGSFAQSMADMQSYYDQGGTAIGSVGEIYGG